MKRVQPYKQGELFSPAEGNFALPKNKFDQYSKKAERNCSKSAYGIDTVYFCQPNDFKKPPLDSFLSKIVLCFWPYFWTKNAFLYFQGTLKQLFSHETKCIVTFLLLLHSVWKSPKMSHLIF